MSLLFQQLQPRICWHGGVCGGERDCPCREARRGRTLMVVVEITINKFHNVNNVLVKQRGAIWVSKEYKTILNPPPCAHPRVYYFFILN